MIDASKDSIAHFQMWWLLYWHAVLAVLVLCQTSYVIYRYAAYFWPCFFALIPAVFAGAWLWYCAAYPWETYRYTLTVNIETDGKAVSNSSTYEVRKAKTPLMYALSLGAPGSSYRTVVFGEAIYFDVNGKPLLFTMAGSGEQNAPTSVSVLAYKVLRFGPTKLVELPPFKKATAEKIGAAVPIGQLPRAITFMDVDDPGSWRHIRRVVDYADTLGPNFVIQSAHLQLTTEQPGWPELPGHLPWLRSRAWIFPIGIRETTSIVTRADTLNKGALINGYF
ncbi:hypothetical protein AUC68_00425 [Methyloceanibacter methanicus]|uniref:Uncharacterized protein n=1 Tax=Methyloceanibacter methanicus TaxID=1774968 RepID=A0A1E3W767_9HYPH|nr:hypothetical protein [Methyloceanibacter methanicus]ODS01362.1 hypothetical protein AUC68_00425 [Methyloceanibacter methanicus]